MKKLSEIQAFPGFSGTTLKFQDIPGILDFSGSVKTLSNMMCQLALWIGLQKSRVRFIFVALVEGISIHH